MKAGVGYSENPNSVEAGAEAARAALAQVGTETCDLAFMFSTSKQDPAQLRDGLRSVIGPDSRVAGGYALGVLTRDYLGYEGYQVGVAALSADSGEDIDLFIDGPLPDNEYAVGQGLGKQILSKEYRGEPNILFLYDAIKERPVAGFSLNMATVLVQGMGEALGTWPPAVGVGMFGDMEGQRGYQWFDDRIEQGAAMAAVFSGGVRIDTIIMHGCRPASGYHTITKAEGATVLEIDGKPAVDVIAELLGPERSWEQYPLFVTLGVNRGDKFGDFNEEEYQNRLVQAVDKERGSLLMFENDLKAGDEFQLMRRSIDFSYMEERVNDLYDRVEGEPFLALYVDCAGRISKLSGTDGEEADEIRRTVGERTPLLGVYSAIEVAKVGAGMQPLDWTGVLCLFSQ